MKRPGRTLLVAAGVLAGLFLLAAALVPVLFSGEKLKPKAEEELSRLIGRNVSLGTPSVSIWSGLALHADSFRVGEPLQGASAGAPVLEAGPTAVHVAFLPLLHKEVVARSITIERARVIQAGATLVSDLSLASRLRVGADGALAAAGEVSARVDALAGRPEARATFDVALTGGALEVHALSASTGSVRVSGSGRVDGISSDAPRARLDLEVSLPKSTASGRFDLIVDPSAPKATFDVAAKLIDLDEVMKTAGSFAVASGAPTPAAGGLVPAAAAAEAAPAAAPDLLVHAHADGPIKAARCVYAGLDMTDVSAKATLDGGRLTLDDTHVSLFGGHARGKVEAHPFDVSRPFSLRQTVEGVGIGSLIAALAPAQKGTVDGKAALEIAVTGRAGTSPLLPTIDGTGSLAVEHGKIASIGMIKQVMALLETAGAKGIAKGETPFDRLSSHFEVAQGVARTQDLQFRSADLDADGRGSVGLGGALDLDVVGTFSKTVSDQLVAKTHALSIQQGADGRLAFPLKLRGTLMAPQVQLDVDAVLQHGIKKKLEEQVKHDLKKKILDKYFKH